jgi:hypothetical protein
MSLTKNQVFTLKSLTRDQSFSLVEPLKFNVRTRRNRPSVEREFKSAQFMHLSRDNKGNLCVSYSIGPMSSSMSGEEFFKKTKISTPLHLFGELQKEYFVVRPLHRSL